MKSIYKNNRYVFLTLSLIFTGQLSQAFEWGFAERQGYRSSMEDAHVIENEVGPCAAYAIFDGHAGKEAADLAAVQLKIDLTMETPFSSLTDMQSWINQVESELAAKDIISGATMITAVIDKKTKFAHLFWVGDARAIVIRNGKIIEATIDHNLKNEAERLKKAQATIVDGYIRNTVIKKMLAPPRTIGDLPFKKNAPAVISDPEMKSIQLNIGDYVVLACDGLWDALSNEDVAQYIASNPKLSPIDDTLLKIAGGKKADPASSQGVLRALAQSLRDKAFSTFKTRDNISVIVVKI